MTLNPASFWLGFSFAIVVMGVIAIVISAAFMRRGEISGSIDSIRPRHWSERSETDEEPRFV